MKSYKWAMVQENDVEFIGVSILACPIALGINESKHGDGARDDAYKMQRYLSRWEILRELDNRHLLDGVYKKLHCLGMTDGPKEIALLYNNYRDLIFSWDSSSAIWHAINGIEYDSSPTGLRDGKCEVEVDFNIAPPDTFDVMPRIAYNMGLIDRLCMGE